MPSAWDASLTLGMYSPTENRFMTVDGLEYASARKLSDSFLVLTGHRIEQGTLAYFVERVAISRTRMRSADR